jgi:hypothetical protein
MANKTLFQSICGALLPATTTRNAEAAWAYAFEPRHALAQYASTGCLNTTFYATDAEQLETVLALCERLEPEFIARLAIHPRERLFMKDMPALLCAVLSRRAPDIIRMVHPRPGTASREALFGWLLGSESVRRHGAAGPYPWVRGAQEREDGRGASGFLWGRRSARYD